jgi:hypothetical protein
MAFSASFLAQPPLRTSILQPSGSSRVLPQQLTSLSSPLPLIQHCRVRNGGATAAVAGVAIPLPSGYSRVSEVQVGRTLMRTTSTGLSDSAEMLKRTLSGKVINDAEAVLQVVDDASQQCFLVLPLT